MNLSTGAPHANHARDPSAKSAERKRRRMRAEHVCLGRRSTCAVTQTSDHSQSFSESAKTLQGRLGIEPCSGQRTPDIRRTRGLWDRWNQTVVLSGSGSISSFTWSKDLFDPMFRGGRDIFGHRATPSGPRRPVNEGSTAWRRREEGRRVRWMEKNMGQLMKAFSWSTSDWSKNG